jgi:plasmid maintenance system killer protein
LIRGFRDRDTERLWNEEKSRRFPADLRRVALRKLQMLDAAAAVSDLAIPPGIGWSGFEAAVKVNTASASTTNIGSALSGRRATLTTWR